MRNYFPEIQENLFLIFEEFFGIETWLHNAVNMLIKVTMDRTAHWIQDEVYAFSASEFCSGNEITVACDEDHL